MTSSPPPAPRSTPWPRAPARSPAWAQVAATLKPSAAPRITVYAPDAQHDDPAPSPDPAVCRRPAYFLLKGRVSDRPGYFGYLRALAASQLLDRYGYRREVVMGPREVRLASLGPGFEPGEFFEILRFPCAERAETFWDSPEYRELVPLRAGKMTVQAQLFE